MSNIVPVRPNRQNLENAKLAVQKVAEKRPLSPTLDKFKEGKSWYGVSEKVTGQDMNLFVTNVQKLISQLNQENIATYKQFTTVYNFFDILDKEYIRYFNQSIDKLEILTEKATNAGNDALEAQKEITRTIQALKLTIEKLTSNKIDADNKISVLNEKIGSFENDIISRLVQLNRIDEIKRSIESYKHFSDIDTIWKDVQNHKTDIATLNHHFDSILETIQLLRNHKDRIESLEHIYDIDMMWEEMENLNLHIPIIDSKLTDMDSNIELLRKHRDRIENLKHIYDIDMMWEDLEKLNLHIPTIDSKLIDVDSNIKLLGKHRDRIESLKHIDDLDTTWEQVEKLKSDVAAIRPKLSTLDISIHSLESYKSQLSSVNHLMDVDKLWSDFQVSKNEITEIKREQELIVLKNAERETKLLNEIRLLQDKVQSNESKSDKKISIAYTLCGVALLFIVVQFFLIFNK